MGAVITQFATVYRDYNTDGVPSSGAHDPSKSEIRAIGPGIEALFAGYATTFTTLTAQAQTAATTAGAYPYTTGTGTPAGVASGAYYWMATSDGKSLQLYLNSSGTRTIQNGVTVPLSAFFSTRVQVETLVVAGVGSTPLLAARVKRGGRNQLVFSGMNIYATGKGGVSLKSITGSALNGTYTFAEDDVLSWDWNTNTIVQGVFPNLGLVLFYYKQGRFVSGDLMNLIEEMGSETAVSSAEHRCIVGNGYSGQGATIVGDKLWSFGQSDTSHTASTSYQYDKETLAVIPGGAGDGAIAQNISHNASASYAKLSDTLLLANGGNVGDTAPRIDLFPNASAFVPGGSLVWATTPRVSISFGDLMGVGQTTTCACFGADFRTVYLVLGDTALEYQITQIELGTGTIDFSSGGYGAFLTGKGVNEYNGTARFVRSWSGPPFGVLQDVCFREGSIYIGLTGVSPMRSAEVLRCELLSNGLIVGSKRFRWPPLNADGTLNEWETEGVEVDDYYLYVTVNRLTSSGMQILKFPLYNEMKGTGVVGTPVIYPFDCISTPKPKIEMTSVAGSVPYISANSPSGFTVAGPTGATFNWAAKIS